MGIDTKSPRFTKRVSDRIASLKRDPDIFLSRFDLNRDGVLDEIELSAATTTITNELLHEHNEANSIGTKQLEIGTIIHERFELISLIGEGAQSSAFVARDLQSDTLVVVKQMRLSHLDTWEAYTSFQRESEFLEQLDHPKVPDLVCKLTIFNPDSDSEKQVFSVQGFLPGQNLDTKIRLGFLYTEELLVSIAEQVLEILAYLHGHEQPILHRDIKPSNILLTDSGEVSVVDFGAVQYVEKSKTLAMGTTGYMPNEQLLGNAIPQSDLHALGVTLVRLATGTPPERLDMKGMQLVWRDKCSLSKGFSNWIDKLIQPISEDRFVSAEIALKFLRDPNYTFIKVDTTKRTLDLQEVFSGKPTGSKLRIWESVDQFVCTFTESIKEEKEWAFGERLEHMFSRLTSNQDILEKTGGGFSMNAKTQVMIQSGKRIKRNKSVMEVITPTQLSRESFDENFGIISTHLTGRSSTFSTNATLVLGLSRDELDWLWLHLESFCDAHRFDILAPEIKYQTYILE